MRALIEEGVADGSIHATDVRLTAFTLPARSIGSLAGMIPPA